LGGRMALPTICGTLHVTPYGNWIACRFYDTEAAVAHFGYDPVYGRSIHAVASGISTLAPPRQRMLSPSSRPRCCRCCSRCQQVPPPDQTRKAQ
jgi:hypothetical protein